MLQVVKEGWYLRFQLLQKVGIIGLQAVYLAHPITCFPCVYDDGQILVVGTQHEALQKITRSNRNRLEIEMSELVLDIMASTGIDTFSFCCNDILTLLANTYVKAEKHQVRKVLQECWKLTPALNGLTYTTYQLNYNRECRYEPIRRVGRFYTVTRQQLETL